MYDKIKEIAAGLRQRQTRCQQMAEASEDRINYGRLTGKASAYGHAAEMLEEVLKEDKQEARNRLNCVSSPAKTH